MNENQRREKERVRRHVKESEIKRVGMKKEEARTIYVQEEHE